jgi:hypothetical protein
MGFRAEANSECASNFVQIPGENATDTLVMIREAFGEEYVSLTRVFGWEGPERPRRVETKDNSMGIIFIDIMEIRPGGPNRQFCIIL